jgi:hypothetical protein
MLDFLTRRYDEENEKYEKLGYEYDEIFGHIDFDYEKECEVLEYFKSTSEIFRVAILVYNSDGLDELIKRSQLFLDGIENMRRMSMAFGDSASLPPVKEVRLCLIHKEILARAIKTEGAK